MLAIEKVISTPNWSHKCKYKVKYQCENFCHNFHRFVGNFLAVHFWFLFWNGKSALDAALYRLYNRSQMDRKNPRKFGWVIEMPEILKREHHKICMNFQFSIFIANWLKFNLECLSFTIFCHCCAAISCEQCIWLWKLQWILHLYVESFSLHTFTKVLLNILV